MKRFDVEEFYFYYTFDGAVPSKKNCMHVRRIRGRPFLSPTKEYQEWEKTQAFLMSRKWTNKKPYLKPVGLIIDIKGSYRSDATNSLDAIADVIQKAGIIKNDNKILDIRIKKTIVRGLPHDRVIIKVYSL